MNLNIKFDGVAVDNASVVGLSQSANLFTDSFRLGSTLCRTFKLNILKSAVSSHPSQVTVFDGTALYATVNVDEIDDQNRNYYSYSLVDSMVNANKEITWTSGATVQQIVNLICGQDYLNCTAPTLSYIGSMSVTWLTSCFARDFLSWAAEAEGGFARINAQGNLEFVTSVSTENVSMETCADFRLGEHFEIDHVFLETGTASIVYPSAYSKRALYINPNNQLITDSGSFTRAGILQHIYNTTPYKDFYNITTSKCHISDSVKVGDFINFVYNSESYKTIAQIEWTYNGSWIGGYSLDVKNEKQELTEIESTSEKVANISIKVDRQAGEISQKVGYGDVISAINQSAEQVTIDADKINLTGAELNFGDYPDGQYITLRDYEVSGDPVGVAINGTGYIQMQPEEQFLVENVDSSDNVMNKLLMDHSSSGTQFNVENYNTGGGHANSINLSANSSGNTFSAINYAGNTVIGEGIPANKIDLGHTLSKDEVVLGNYTTSGTLTGITVNKLEISSSISSNTRTNKIELRNYIAGAGGSTQPNTGLLVNDTTAMLGTYAGSGNSVWDGISVSNSGVTLQSRYASTPNVSITDGTSANTFNLFESILPYRGETTDCDTALSIGRYYANSSASNIPTSASFNIVVFPVGNSASQLAFTRSVTSRMWIRSSNTSGTFGAWKEMNAITASDIGLGNVDNTSDANKPISTATQTALDNITTSTNTTATWNSDTTQIATKTNNTIYKRNGIVTVYLRFTTGSTYTSGMSIATLPAGYKPAFSGYYAMADLTDRSTTGICQISSGGGISFSGSRGDASHQYALVATFVTA